MSKKIVDSGFRDWTPDRLPDLRGKTYLITGGNSGIGLEAAKMLAAAGGKIIVASRNRDKAAAAVEALPDGAHETVELDLASLASVRAAAENVRTRFERLDALINNAGIMQTPQSQTAEGFELQLGTNHLGHFLFAGLLFDLVESANGRVVTVSSLAHKLGAIHFDDLMLTHNYEPTRAYAQSKLANLMFALAFDRRLKAAGSAVASIGCHPGYSATQLQSTGPSGFLNVFYKLTNLLMAQPASNGAIPTVLAAAGTEAVPGAYYGPKALQESRGRVSDAVVADRARDEAAQDRLWSESERLVDFEWKRP